MTSKKLLFIIEWFRYCFDEQIGGSMYGKEQRRRLLNLITNFVILFFEVASFGFVWYRYYNNKDYATQVPVVVIMYGVFVFLITKSLNGYKIRYMRVIDLCLSHAIAIVCSGVVAYFMISMVWHDNEDILPIVCMAGMQIVFSMVWVWFVRLVTEHICPPRRIIIIYGNYPADSFIHKLNDRGKTYKVCEILNYQKGFDRICNDVLDFEGVFLYDLPGEERNEIIKYCYKNSIRTYVVPKISDIIMKSADDLHLVDTPIYLSRNIGLNIDQRIEKRITDIIISLFGIIITAPLMLIVAIVIKLYDGGPVFYRQERLTIGGKKFNIFKFRSMKIDAEAGGAQLAQKDDDRITPVGRVLRNLHIDELPQLFNVFAGDMSLVGPRPERPEIFEQYKESVPNFDFRLKVKAGLTGYAQVYGKYNTTPIDKLKLDLTYIQSYSYWLDIKLMLLTFRVVFQKETSEGVEKTQKTALKK